MEISREDFDSEDFDGFIFDIDSDLEEDFEEELTEEELIEKIEREEKFNRAYFVETYFAEQTFLEQLKKESGSAYEIVGPFKTYGLIEILHTSCDRTFKVKANIFSTPKKLRVGQTLCPICCKELILKNKALYTKEQLNKRYKKDYILIESSLDICNDNAKFIHTKCGNEFDKSLHQMLYNKTVCPCPFCRPEVTTLKNKSLFLTKLSNLHKDEYSLIGEYFNSICKTTFKHKTCGREFESTPSYMLKPNDYYCPYCKPLSDKKCSAGELKIEQFLKDNNIKYKTQYTFDDLKYINALRFDFGVLDEENNLAFLIEFDGQQHYKSVDYWGGADGLKQQKKRDKKKNKYCEEKGIPLVRIPYTKFANIEQILEEKLTEYGLLLKTS